MYGYDQPRSRPDRGLNSLSRLENIIYVAPVPAGLILGVCALLCGAGAGYAALEMIVFALLSPLIYLIRHDDRYTGTVILVAFAKIFFISQVVCLFLLKAPDANLMRPLMTELAIGVGLVAAMLGVGAAALAFSVSLRGEPLLHVQPDAAVFRRLGYPAAVIGLTSQAIWTAYVGTLSGDQHNGIGPMVSGLSLFSDLSPLAILSICCFAAARLLETRGRSVLSTEFVAVLGAYLVLIAPLATKAEPLKPIVALAVLAAVFRWRPPLAMIAGGVIVVVFVAEFLYPTITLARLRSFGDRRPLPIVFAETAMDSVTDPSTLGYVKAFTKNYDRSLRSFYYGEPTGFLDRFTPRVTDELVKAADYTTPIGWKEFGEGARSLLPQTFGFKRDITGNQRRIEIALLRRADQLGRVSWENSGLVGGGFLAGGLAMVAAYLFVFAFLSSLMARITFGTNGGSILWIPFLVTFMLIPADATMSGMAPLYFWGWLLMTGAIALLIRVFADQRRPRLAG